MIAFAFFKLNIHMFKLSALWDASNVTLFCRWKRGNIHLFPTLTPTRDEVSPCDIAVQWTWRKTHLVFILWNSSALLWVELAELRWGRELSKCQLALQHHCIGSRHVNAWCRLRSHGGSKWSQCWLCWNDLTWLNMALQRINRNLVTEWERFFPLTWTEAAVNSDTRHLL